jgi:hypothetical protein
VKAERERGEQYGKLLHTASTPPYPRGASNDEAFWGPDPRTYRSSWNSGSRLRT